MIQQNNPHEYDDLIKKIAGKKRTIVIITIIAVVLVIVSCSPVYMAVLDDVIIDYKGVHPLLTALFVLILLFCELVAISIVTAPLTKSIDVECDPQKHLILNASLNKRKDLDYVYAMDLFFMGDFKGALGYANKMVAHKKATTVSVGLFNKARCEFFLGDFESMRVTVQQYEAVVAGLKKRSEKVKASYDRIQRVMALQLAIADNNREGMEQYRDAAATRDNSKAAQGYIDYLKGVAAYHLDDKEESIYRLKAVKEHCSKTVLAALADQYLAKLK